MRSTAVKKNLIDKLEHLDQLTITNRVAPVAKRPRKQQTIEYKRSKLIANIEEQIELATLAIADEPLVIKRKRGKSVRTVKPRIWWEVVEGGLVVAEVRYNKVALNLAGLGTSIEVAKLEELPAALKVVIDATNAGELDQSIRNASKKSKP